MDLKELIDIFMMNRWLWFILTVGFSLFYGFRGIGMIYINYISTPPTTDSEKRKKDFYFYVFECPHQFIFNSFGAFAGWACFYLLISRIHDTFCIARAFSAGDVVLFIVAMIGITGHLPQTLYGFVNSFSLLAKAIAEKLTEKVPANKD